MVTKRAGCWIVAGLVLSGLAGGCSRPSTRPASTSTSAVALVRAGQTGDFVAIEPGRPGEPPPPAVPPQVFLNIDLGASGYARSLIPHTPIVVTENPADEEFWEFQYRLPAAATGVGAENFDRPRFVIGPRNRCEAVREGHERGDVRTGPCVGPHYFKRTGLPVLEKVPPGYNPLPPLWSEPPRR